MSETVNSYAIIREIFKSDVMTPSEKVAGGSFALHLNRASGTINVRQSVIADECGVSERVVRAAVAKLLDLGILELVKKGRRNLYRVPEGWQQGLVCKGSVGKRYSGGKSTDGADATATFVQEHRNMAAANTGRNRPKTGKKRGRFLYEDPYSTDEYCEELYKRELDRQKLEDGGFTHIFTYQGKKKVVAG